MNINNISVSVIFCSYKKEGSDSLPFTLIYFFYQISANSFLISSLLLPSFF